MNMPNPSRTLAAAPYVLLQENDYMIRQTFSMHAKETGLAQVVQTSGLPNAKQKCDSMPFNLVILGFTEWEEEVDLIKSIRAGITMSQTDIPIIAIVPIITLKQLDELKQLNISEVLIRPLRIRNIQEAFSRTICN